MDTTSKPTNRFKILIGVGLSIVIIVGVSLVVSVFLWPRLSLYIGKASLAIVSMTGAVVVLRHRRQVLLLTIVLLSSGLLFLLSGAIDGAYDAVIRPLPITTYTAVFHVVNIEAISRGLMFAGFGFVNLVRVLSRQEQTPTPSPMNWLWIGSAFIFFVAALLSFIN